MEEMPEIEKIIITKKEGGFLFGVSNETGTTEIYFENTHFEKGRIKNLVDHWLDNSIYMDGGH
jgi:hypothetical protein